MIYAGKNPDTGQPIIKVFLNPLVNWIWIGVVVIILGTAIALYPSKRPSSLRSAAPLEAAEAVTAGN